MRRKENVAPTKRTMNLYFKQDCTMKSVTVALYVMLGLALMSVAGKFLVYDLWAEVNDARAVYAEASDCLNVALEELKDYDEVKWKYQTYAFTDEEREKIDRIKVIALLDKAVAPMAQMQSYVISGNTVQMQFDRVTLSKTADIVRRLEKEPLVASTIVNTASTTDGDGEMVMATILINIQKEEKSQEEQQQGGTKEVDAKKAGIKQADAKETGALQGGKGGA